jgi:UDP-N-acetylmuramoyl-tripeptide--D-alanyl-D-alanine ligase
MTLLTNLERWLGQAAKKTLERERPLVIAVTGSVGKSSTKEAIGAMLSADEAMSRVRISRKNYNNELGLPLTIFGADAPGRSVAGWIGLLWKAWLIKNGFRKTDIRTFVLEMGADKPGDLAYLTSIAPPDIAVVTAVTPEDPAMAPVHAANYASVDALAEEKATLVRAIKSGGTVVLNADDRRAFAMRHLTREHVITFGESEGAEIRLIESRVIVEAGSYGNVPKGLEVKLESFNRQRLLFIPGVFGKSIAYAISAGIGVAAALDIGLPAVERLSTHFHPLPGRARIIPGIKYTTLFDDSYNASPVAVLSALRDLAGLTLQPGQRRAACLGEMRELGEQAEMLHRMVGGEAAKLGMDLLVCVGAFSRAMADGARAAGMAEDRVRIFEDTPEAGLFLQDWIKPGDVVLAKASEGSRDAQGKLPTGVRMERVIKELMADPMSAAEWLCRQEESWKRK